MSKPERIGRTHKPEERLAGILLPVSIGANVIDVWAASFADVTRARRTENPWPNGQRIIDSRISESRNPDCSRLASWPHVNHYRREKTPGEKNQDSQANETRVTAAYDIAARWVQYWLGNASRLIGTGYSGNVHPSPNGRDIYSYGSHFSMCHVVPMDPASERRYPRLFLLNGDSYSSSTTQHQSAVRSAIDSHGGSVPRIIVPFTALDAAGIDYDSIKPAEVTSDGYETINHQSSNLDDVPIGEKQVWRDGGYVNRERASGGLFHWTTQRHWLGASVFTADYSTRVTREHCGGPRFTGSCEHGFYQAHTVRETVTRTATFLSAFDDQERIPLYFLCELPRRARSVKHAMEMLKPPAVKRAEDCTRQGDIFAIRSERNTRQLRKMGAAFGSRNGGTTLAALAVLLETNHLATKTAVLANGRTFARGCLYHANGDHARRKMGDGRAWHEIFRNTVPRSFGAQPRAWTIRGNVD